MHVCSHTEVNTFSQQLMGVRIGLWSAVFDDITNIVPHIHFFSSIRKLTIKLKLEVITSSCWMKIDTLYLLYDIVYYRVHRYRLIVNIDRSFIKVDV